MKSITIDWRKSKCSVCGRMYTVVQRKDGLHLRKHKRLVLSEILSWEDILVILAGQKLYCQGSEIVLKDIEEELKDVPWQVLPSEDYEI